MVEYTYDNNHEKIDFSNNYKELIFLFKRKKKKFSKNLITDSKHIGMQLDKGHFAKKYARNK